MAATFTIAPSRVALSDGWDVVVAGGGPAGCAAAIGAARAGARVLLLERTGCLGGMATSGLVPAWCGFNDGVRYIHHSVAERVRRRMARELGCTDAEIERVECNRFLDPEAMKLILDDFVGEAGVTVLFVSTVAGVEMAGNGVIDALLVANKSGLTAVRGRVYVDATGDGDLAAWAGAEFAQGDETGEMQPVSLCYTMSNVDTEAAYGRQPQGWRDQVIADSKYPDIACLFFDTGCRIGPGVHAFNAGHLWGIDGTNPASLSRGLTAGRRLADQFRRALAEYHPEGFAHAHLTTTAALLGVRETRRVVGDYVLTAEDHRARRSFDDEIARNSFFLDVHASRQALTGADTALSAALDLREKSSYGPGESHGIPYRCLTPRGLSNLLVAGRSVSCDRLMQGALRVMPPCFSMGEAAGIAATQAARMTQADVHGVDVTAVRRAIREAGGHLPSA